jgi:3-oxoadipate enol-lactonase
MPHMQANGQDLYYEVHGEGEPLLCVAGLAMDTVGWLPQLPAFSARHRTVIFDNRDVGRSSMAEGPYEVRDMAQDALALADGLELESFHLLGVSMGGAIAQEMALAAPDRVPTLTLAVTFPAGNAASRKLAEAWGSRVQVMTREQRVDELLLLTMSEAWFEDAGTVEWLRGVMLDHPHFQPAEAFARQLDAAGRHDARDRLGTLEMPVHVIGAERDILVPAWKHLEVNELIPGSKLTVLEGAHHGITLERSEEFNAAVLDFIAEAGAVPAA